MKKLLIILLIFIAGFVQAQGPVHTDWDIPTAYSMPNFSKITVFMPLDSITGGKHPVAIEVHGSGTVGHYLYTDGATYDSPTGASIEKGGTQITATNGKYGGTSSFIIVKVHLPSGSNVEMARIKDAYNFMRANYASYIDTTQMYASGLSLGGKPILDLMQEDSAIWRHRFAAYASMAAVQGNISTNSGIVANINTDSMHYRLYWCDDDNSNAGAPQTQNTNLMTLQFGFGNQLHIYKVQPIVPMTGGHGGSWTLAYETGHTTLSVDSSWYDGNSTITANQNKTYTHTPNLWEWYLTYNNPATIVTGPPSCTTNASPANASTVPYGSIATISWNFAATATSYNLYYWTGSTPPGSPTVSGITGLTYNITGLTGSTLYHWYVAPANSFGAATGCSSSATTFTTNTPGTIDSLAKYEIIVDVSGGSVNDPDNLDNLTDSKREVDPLFIGDTTTSGNPVHNWGQHNGWPKYPFGSYFPVGNSMSNDPVNDSTFYPGKRAHRFYLSTVNYENWTDTSLQFHARKLFWYELAGTPAGLSTAIINCDSCIIAQTTHDGREWRMARSDSLCPYNDSIVTTGVAGWHSKTINMRPFRWLLFVTQRVSGNCFNASQLLLYGQYTGAEDTSKIDKDVTDTTLLYNYVLGDTMHTSYHMNAVNAAKGVNSSDVGVWGGDRLFNGWGGKNIYFMKDTTHQGISGGINFWFGNTSDMTVNYLRQLETKGMWNINTLSGASGYNVKHGWPIINIDHPGTDDPERVSSFTTLSKGSFLIYSKFGGNAISSSLTTEWGGTDAGYPNGLGLKHLMFTWGNEARNAGKTDGEVFAERDALYDGHEGAFGAGYGKKNADSTMMLTDESNSSMAFHDLRATKLHSQFLRASKTVPYDAQDSHYYPSKIDSSGTTNTYTQQIGASAVTPERAWSRIGYDYITYCQKYNLATIKYTRYGRTKPVLRLLTERSGGAQDSIVSRTDSVFLADGVTRQLAQNTSVGHDLYTIVPISGLTADQTRALYARRYEVCGLFTGFDILYTYVLENSSSSADHLRDSITSALFGSMGEGARSSISSVDSFALIIKYANYWVHTSALSKEGRFGPDKQMKKLDSIGINLFRLRSAYRSDSVCYSFWLGSISGATQMVDIAMPGVTAADVVTPSYTSKTPTITHYTVTGGVLHVLATEMPQNAYAVETSGTNTIGPRSGVLFKRVIRQH